MKILIYFVSFFLIVKRTDPLVKILPYSSELNMVIDNRQYDDSKTIDRSSIQ